MIEALTQAVLSLSVFPLSTIVKTTLILALALVAVWRARRARAATRHLILACAFGAALVIPGTELAVPAVTLPVAQPVAGAAAHDTSLNLATLPILVSEGLAEPASLQKQDMGGEGDSGAARLAPSVLLPAAWLAGATLFLIPVLITPGRLRALRLTSRSWPEGEELVRVMASGVRRPVAVLLNDRVAAPLTCGIVRPVIVLPSDALRWRITDVQQALVHELEHIRRADWPVQITTRIVCAVYWFNPLAWIAWRHLSLEAERACDDAVLSIGERTAYAQQLVTLARHARTSPMPVLSMASRSELSSRITAVLDEAQVRGRLGFHRAAAIVATAAVVAAGIAPLRVTAQAPGQVQPAGAQQAPVPRFEVVSVKPSAPEPGDGPNIGMPGAFLPGGLSPADSATTRRFGALNVELEIILHRAYPEFARPGMLIAPDWISNERFDIDARAGTDVPVRLMRLMLRQLLADRFALQSHTETRQVDIYHLVLARGDGTLGRRLRSASGVCDKWNAQQAAAGLGDTPPQQPKQSAGATPCGMTAGIRPDTPLRTFSFGGQELSGLVTMLSSFVGTNVIDRTGLTGRFDIELSWADTSDGRSGIPLDANDAQDRGPSLTTALEDQLGLKLQKARGMAEVLVIDRIERPTPN